MADDAELAQERQQNEMERVAAVAAGISRRFAMPSLYECVDCDGEIPEARRQIGGVVRCVECEGFAEQRRGR